MIPPFQRQVLDALRAAPDARRKQSVLLQAEFQLKSRRLTPEQVDRFWEALASHLIDEPELRALALARRSP